MSGRATRAGCNAPNLVVVPALCYTRHSRIRVANEWRRPPFVPFFSTRRIRHQTHCTWAMASACQAGREVETSDRCKTAARAGKRRRTWSLPHANVSARQRARARSVATACLVDNPCVGVPRECQNESSWRDAFLLVFLNSLLQQIHRHRAFVKRHLLCFWHRVICVCNA